MAKDKNDKGKGKSKGDEKGGKDKGGKDKGDDKGGKDKWREEKGKGKDKDKENKSKNASKGGDQDNHKTERSQLSSAAPDFTPAMGNYGNYGMYGDWPAEPPAPPLWSEHKDEDDVPFYHNAKTGLCQWEMPPELQPPKPAGPQINEGNRDRRDPVIKREPDRDDRRRDRDRDDDGGGRSKGDGKNRRRDKGGKGDKGKDGEPSEFGPPGCNLFVFHLPDDWTDDDLHEYFAPHGNVISAKVMKELGTGRSRGFGFVSYEDRVSSATAIKKMQGYKILGKRLKVEFKKGEQESNDMMGDTDMMRDLDGDGEGKKSYPDDERLIGYLRAISAKNVVQSKDDDARSGDGDAAAAEDPERPEPSDGGD